MLDHITISLDAMGGSGAPSATIEGASLALSQIDNLYIMIHGDQNILAPWIAKYPILQERSEVINTHAVVLDDEQPIKALKYGRESSMRKVIDSVKDGVAHACVSSGNTGALMVMAKMVLGDLPGIKRPAIVGVFPNKVGGSVMLDLGANVECDEINLFQFALMGSCYAKIILKKVNPTVGLLNIGSEEIKGTELQKKTYKLLKESNLNFKGYVEGFDIAQGTVDVIVADGFSGNLVIKAAEGTARLCMDFMKAAFTSSTKAKLGGWLAKSSLKKTFEIINPNNVNGAMFVGVDGIVVKSHGSSNATGVANAIKVAHDLAQRNINLAIAEELKAMHKESDNIVAKIKRTLGMG